MLNYNIERKPGSLASAAERMRNSPSLYITVISLIFVIFAKSIIHR